MITSIAWFRRHGSWRIGLGLSIGVLAAIAPSPVLAQDAGPVVLMDDLLALCRSEDLVARRYCLDQIEAAGDPEGRARSVLGDMAQSDEALSVRAAELYRALYAAEPPPAEAEDVPDEDERRPGLHGDPTRVILSPTAFTRPKGLGAANFFQIGTFWLDFGISDGFQVGVQTAIPVFALTVGTSVKGALSFETGAVGLHGTAIVIAPFEDGTEAVGVFGGGAVLTLGNRRHFFNVGLATYAITEDSSEVVLAPHFGASTAVSRSLRLGAEVYIPYATGSDEVELAAILWGVRIFGDTIWGDIALLDPICDGCEDIYEVIPLGIPFVNLGFAW